MKTKINNYIQDHYLPCEVGNLTHEMLLTVEPSLDFTKEDHKELVREVVKDHFRGFGSIAVLFPSNKLIIKTYVDERIKEIAKYVALKKDAFKPSTNALIIMNAQLEPVYYNMKFKSEQEKRSISYRAICRGLNLSKQDAIIFLSDHIVIQYRPEPEKLDNRFLGLPKEELEKLYKDVCENIDREDIDEVIYKIEANRLNFSQISNEEFEKSYISAIQKELFQWINSKTAQKALVIKGLANFFFREHFEYFLETLAEILLEKVASRDKNAIDFFKYFTDDLVIVGNKKYKKPVLQVDKKPLSLINAANILKKEHERTKKEESMISYIEKLQKMIRTEHEKCNAALALEARLTQEYEAAKTALTQGGELLKSKRAEFMKLKQENKTPSDEFLKEIAQLEREDAARTMSVPKMEKDLSQQQRLVKDITQNMKSKKEILEQEIEKFNAFKNEDSSSFRSYTKILKAVARLFKEKKKLIA